MPGGGRLTGGAAACCGGGAGGGALATGGGGGLGGATGLHCSTLCLRSASSAASCAFRFFSAVCASSSDAFSIGVGSGGGGGAGGAGVSRVAMLVAGSTGAQARSNHDAISSASSSRSPNRSAPSHGERPHPAAAGRAGALANVAEAGAAAGNDGSAPACRLAAASAS